MLINSKNRKTQILLAQGNFPYVFCFVQSKAIYLNYNSILLLGVCLHFLLDLNYRVYSLCTLDSLIALNYGNKDLVINIFQVKVTENLDLVPFLRI